jgi:hypothetical protein
MTDTSVDQDRVADSRTTERVRAVAAEFSARGMTTHMTDARVGLDLTATLASGRQREPEFWIDEDGYAELRYWNPPDATPAQVASAALRALEVVTSLALDSNS